MELKGFFILYCPTLYLLVFNHYLYRVITDQLFTLWQLYPVALFQCLYHTELHHYGDYVRPEDTAIIVMNHRTRVDWNYMWIALYHATKKTVDNEEPYVSNNALKAARFFVKSKSVDEINPLIHEKPKTKVDLDFDEKTHEKCEKNIEMETNEDHVKIGNAKVTVFKNGGCFFDDFLSIDYRGSKLKFVLKDEIKHIPGLGWIMQLNHFLYLKRDWSSDQASVARFLEYYRRLKYRYQVLLFPEGTDLSHDNQTKSDQFATRNNLQHYDFVLHPRTTGFAVLCTRMRQSQEARLQAVYDVTLAYDAPPDSELHIASGKMPAHVYIHLKRYAAEELPMDEEALRCWLTDRWRDKEANLHHFHNEDAFLDVASGQKPTRRAPRDLLEAKMAFVFWTLVDITFFLGLVYSSWFQFWITYNSLLFVFVGKYFGGFQNVQSLLL